MQKTLLAILLILPVVIVACGGGGGNNGDGIATFQMGGNIQGVPLDLSSDVITIAGSPVVAGGDDGYGSTARLMSPRDITTDGSVLYIADTTNSTIRQFDISTRFLGTLVGGLQNRGYLDSVGTAALFDRPKGITTDGKSLYVPDTGNHVIRKVNLASLEVTTLAGRAGTADDIDGVGTFAAFDSPNKITTDGTNLYIADTGNHKIKKLNLATREVSTFVGNGLAGIGGNVCSDAAVGAIALLDYPTGVTTDGTYLYEHADPRQGAHPDWGTLIFNFGRTEVRQFLISNA